jgi:hypothetical protein
VGDVGSAYEMFGDSLNWDTAASSVSLRFELPFWLMVPSTELRVSVVDVDFVVQIRNDHYELHTGEFSDSR